MTTRRNVGERSYSRALPRLLGDRHRAARSRDGKARRKWHSFHGTKRQAQDKCAQLISELNGGLYIEPAKVTVGQFLDRWLEHTKPLVSPRTHERYGEL